MSARYTFSLSDEEGAVLEAMAHMAGHTGRPGVWIRGEVRASIERAMANQEVRDCVEALLAARADYRARHGRRTRHGFGVIDGGASP